VDAAQSHHWGSYEKKAIMLLDHHVASLVLNALTTELRRRMRDLNSEVLIVRNYILADEPDGAMLPGSLMWSAF
jgi:hypothetical protein